MPEKDLGRARLGAYQAETGKSARETREATAVQADSPNRPRTLDLVVDPCDRVARNHRHRAVALVQAHAETAAAAARAGHRTSGAIRQYRRPSGFARNGDAGVHGNG